MATSGEKYTAFARHRLVCRWSINRQDISNNYTIVTGFLYLRSMDGYGAISASATGQAQVTINGQKQTENATSQLSANQNKLLLAKDYRVGHNSDGTKTAGVSGSYYVNVTFAGVYYGTINVGNFNAVLPKIPRHSSLNAIPTFTVPDGCSFSINRQSNFTHNLSFWVQNRANPTLSDDSHWTWLTDLSNVATSGKFNFNDGQLATIADRIKQYAGGGGTIQGKVKLWTNGVSGGPSAQRTVQIAHPAPASPTSSDFTLKENEVINIKLDGLQTNNKFSYDVVFRCAGWSKSWSNIKGNNKITWTLTQAEANEILSRFTESTKNGFEVEVSSKLCGKVYRNSIKKYWSALVDASLASPIVTNKFIHEDTNPISIAVTGDKTILLNQTSRLKVTISSSSMESRQYGKIVAVEANFNGIKRRVDYKEGDMIIDMGVITGVSDNLTVSAIDSRGLAGSASYPVSILAYTPPTINFNVYRKNGFETTSTISGTSVWSPVNNKNAITSIQYQIGSAEKQNLAFTVSSNIVSLTAQSLELDNSKQWSVTIFITDKIGTYSRTYNLSEGKPLMFIDPKRKSVAFGDFPTTGEERNLSGVIEIEAERYHSTGKTGIQMNNSDISGLNGVFFSNDTMDNNGEGIHFIKSGKDINSSNQGTDYDRFYMRDNGFYVNHDTTPIFKVADNGRMYYPATMLWSGGWFMVSGQDVTPSKPLSECRNGWVLMWSKYDNNKQYWADMVSTYIGKELVTTSNPAGVRIAFGGWGDVLVHKYLTITDTQIKGNSQNSGGSPTYGGRAVLVRIHEF